MKEPDPRNSRLVLAGAAIALAAVGVAGFVLGRGSVVADQVPTAANPIRPTPVVAATPASAPDRVLDRAAVIALAAAAADATAQGERAPPPAAGVGDARFSIAIAFGCGGALGEGDGESAGWRYDQASGALRVQFPATRWSPQDWWGDAPPAQVETIEGFWIPRPWASVAICPAEAATPVLDVEPVTLAGQTLAIGQAFARDGARSERRDGQPYLAVQRVAPDAVKTERGFRLRLSGRLSSFPTDNAVQCRQPGGADQRPICLVAATFDEVAIENATTGETIGRWSATGSPRAD